MASEAKNDLVRIIDNGQPKTVDSTTVTFEEAVKLAYPTPPVENATYTVTYRNAVEPREGTLAPGGSVTVRKEGTVFNVRVTGRS